MKQKRARAQARELTVLLVFMVPGGGLFLWGIRSCAAAHHFGMPGAIGVMAGLCLAVVGGFYHYSTDFKGAGGRRAAVAFLAITGFSALAAFLANRLLFR